MPLIPKERAALLFFVKSPEPGKVKTRLGADLGHEAACRLYSCFAADMLAQASKTGMKIIIFFAPREKESQVCNWLGGDYEYSPQEGADLGDRMKNAFSRVFLSGADKAILMGSDIPGLPASVMIDAEEKLDHSQCVMGPSADGGYYLIGFTKDGFAPRVFHGPEWGESSVASQTMAMLAAEKIKYSLVRQWRDVDDLSDLIALYNELKTSPEKAPGTMNFLNRLAEFQELVT